MLAAGLAVLASSAHVTRRVELASVDARFSVRGTQRPPDDVVVVGLDAQSLVKLNARPPIPRHYHAEVIDTLRRDGALVIAYDFQFTAPSTQADDGALLDALGRTPGVILGSTIGGPGGHVLGDEHTRLAVHAIGASTAFPKRTTRGGVFRRIVYSNNGLTSFAVVAAERAVGHPVSRSSFSGDGAWIDYAGSAGTIPTVSLSDVVAGKVPASRFRGKVVVVGATDPIIQDIHPTSAGEAMPGPEINANAISTILRGFPLRDSAGWLSLLMIVLAGIVTPAGALRWHGIRWLPIPIAAAIAIPVAAQLAFDGGTILPLAAPGLALILSLVGTLTVAYWTDLRERRRLRTSFARFVPPQVVDELIAQADDELRLGGRELQSTVMFCDLRGFTSVAEHLPAEQVIDLLNRYLTEMSDAILEHGGTVVSYMGDGIMAVFGAPLPQDDHADRAVAAAREMLGERLPRFNEWALESGVAEPFRMGVGLNSGPVMSGNVGSTRRLEYTAVGDTTNTASRLEGMTKDAGTPVLISDATKDALRAGGSALTYVGELELRGRATRLKAWTLTNDRGAGDIAGPAGTSTRPDA